ncbi:MAG: DUF2306 domain-containing protein [Bacteroidota bacterium]
MKRKISWYILSVFSLLVGLYPVAYFFLPREAGLLSTKPDQLLDNGWWQFFFVAHLCGGGLSLLIGWAQFSTRWRENYPRLHRTLGKVYLLAVWIGGTAALYLAFFATGGWVTGLGFFSLAAAWLATTVQAYVSIRQGHVVRHQQWMVLSYAATLAAVTLRIEMPILIALTGNFFTAYPIVAWSCWVPNLLVGAWIAFGGNAAARSQP